MMKFRRALGRHYLRCVPGLLSLRPPSETPIFTTIKSSKFLFAISTLFRTQLKTRRLPFSFRRGRCSLPAALADPGLVGQKWRET